MTSHLRGEDRLQAEVVARLREGGYLCFHCPNEGMHKPQYRAKMKAKGLLPGVSDVIILDPPPIGGYVGAMLELKMPGKKPTPTQNAFMINAAVRGWAVGWTVGLPASIQALRWWGYQIRGMRT